MIVETIDKLWDYDNPAESEKRFRELFSTLTDPVEQAELLTQIARAQGLQRHFDEAYATLNQVESRLPGLSEPRVRIRTLLERGRVFNSSGQPERASPLFHEALKAAEAAGEDSFAVDAAHMLGISAPPEERLHWNEVALSLAQKSKEPRAQNWQGSLYNNIGWTYHDQGDFEKALSLFEQALAFREKQGKQENIFIARWCVARALRSLKRLDEALEKQLQLLAEMKALDKADGYVNEEIGECLLELGKPAEAREYFGQAHQLLSTDQWLVESEPERLARLKKLSES